MDPKDLVERSEDELDKAIMGFANDVGVRGTYLIVPAESLSYNRISKYFLDLADADTLKYRFSDQDKATSSWAANHHTTTAGCFFVVNQRRSIVAEFQLSNFIGKAAQIDFCMHPDKATDNMAELVTNAILKNWTIVENMYESYLETIYGLTPVDNRAACLFVLKAGFKKVGILPSGSSYLNSITDSLITIKQVV